METNVKPVDNIALETNLLKFSSGEGRIAATIDNIGKGIVLTMCAQGALSSPAITQLLNGYEEFDVLDIKSRYVQGGIWDLTHLDQSDPKSLELDRIVNHQVQCNGLILVTRSTSVIDDMRDLVIEVMNSRHPDNKVKFSHDNVLELRKSNSITYGELQIMKSFFDK